MMQDVTPEQAAEGMRPWMEWAERSDVAVLSVDPLPLGPGGLHRFPDGF